jgi:hypothetical protein
MYQVATLKEIVAYKRATLTVTATPDDRDQKSGGPTGDDASVKLIDMTT